MNYADHKRQFGSAECEALATEAKETVALLSFANRPLPSQSDVD